MSLPLVSIVTPTFNHERYIAACVESVLNQSYKNWEQIVIDDGSADGTADIVRSVADPRVHYIHQQNTGIEGLAHTYNRALRVCRGELVAILEGDDTWPREKLTRLVTAFEDENVVLAYGAVADMASDGTWKGRLGRSVRRRMRLPTKILRNDPVGSATSYMLRADGVDLVPPSTVIIRRAALDAIGGFQYVPDLCVTDFPTFLRLSLFGNFHYTPTVMGYRRRHLNSATYNNFSRILKHAHQYVDQFLLQHALHVSAAERHAIDKSWSRSRSPFEFTAGRLELANGHWKAARGHFALALRQCAPRIFLASAVGWSLSWFHCDLEKLFGLGRIARMESSKEGRGHERG